MLRFIFCIWHAHNVLSVFAKGLFTLYFRMNIKFDHKFCSDLRELVNSNCYVNLRKKFQPIKKNSYVIYTI